MLSFDLAGLYGVAPKALVQAVKRNRDRFPADFLFRLDFAEARELKDAGARLGWGTYAKYPPFAFTEQGVAMLSSVLRSKKAIRANISIMRAFVKVRELSAQNCEILKKLQDLEKRVNRHDADIGGLIDAIREDVLPESSRQIGFRP